MNIRPLRIATWCLAGALPLVTWAEPPGGQDRGPGGHRGFGPGGGDRRGGFGDATGDERQKFFEQLKAFCSKHSPRRWQEIEDRMQRGPGGGGRRLALMMFRFKELQKLEKEDPALHAIKVRQIEVEDVEYGLITDLKDTDKADQKRLADLRAKLREQNKESVDLRLQERSRRIERLAHMIEKEKQKLADDRRNADQLADQRLADLEKQGPDFFNPRFRRPSDGDNASSTAPSATQGGPGALSPPPPPR